MAGQDLTRLTVAELGPLIQRKEITPVEVAEAYLRRIEALEPQLNAFITRIDDHARREARKAEAEIMAGLYRGPFHGIPVGLKDLFWTKGIRTTSGSVLDADFVPTEDAAVVARLNEAGAYGIGKLHMTEFAFDGTSRNEHYGPARNPWDTRRMAGGSSSGSGVAVASGEVPLALGTDTGGSVRVPAALCGVTGLKPTFGLISRFGVTPLSWSMDHVGVLAHTAQDAALALNLLAGHDPRDPGSIQVEPQDYTQGLDKSTQGLRIGVPQEFIWDVMDPEVNQAFRDAMSHFETLGVTVQDISMPDLDLVNPAGSVVQTAEAAAFHRRQVLAHGPRYDPAIRRRFESGLFIPAEAYLQAQRVRAKSYRSVLQTLEQVDMIATPTTAIAAPYIDQEQVTLQGQEVSAREALLRITRIFSTLGLPAISIPCGFTADGLPVGLQLVARPLAENLLLGVAHSYQQSTQWHLRWPEM